MNQDQGNKSATKRQAEHAGKVRLLTASEREELGVSSRNGKNRTLRALSVRLKP